MTRQSRKIFFWLAVAVFLVATPLIVGYARGWRFDFENGALTQVGAIVLKSEPKDAEIFLANEKINKKTPGVIKNLLPFHAYSVKVEKNGYQSWSKNLQVEPEKITAVQNIFLFFQELNFEPALENIKISSFVISPKGEKIFFINEAGQANMFLLAEQKTIPIVFNDKLITYSFKDIKWSKEDDNILFARQVYNRKIWYRFDISNNELLNLTNLYENNIVLGAPSKKPLPRFFNPQNIKFLGDRDFIAVMTEGNIFVLDIKQNALIEIEIKKEALHLTTSGDNIFVLDEDLVLIKLNKKGEFIKSWPAIDFVPFDIITSPDGKKMAYFHNYAVGVMWLEDINGGELKKEGEKDLVFQSPRPINKLWWHYSSEYLVIKNRELLTVEIDGRGEDHNIANWTLDDIKEIEYSPEGKSLWALKKDGALSRHPENF